MLLDPHHRKWPKCKDQRTKEDPAAPLFWTKLTQLPHIRDIYHMQTLLGVFIWYIYL